MTPLARLLAERIVALGPLTVAEFMVESLLHPDHGYYATPRGYHKRAVNSKNAWSQTTPIAFALPDS